MKSKRILSLFLALLLLVVMIPLTASAAGAGLSGPQTVRAGDTITLTFSVNNCSGVIGVEGQISYDSSVLTLVGSPVSQRSGWNVTLSNGWFTMFDSTQTNPVNGSATLFTLTFRVNANAAAGKAVQVTASNVVMTDGTNSSNASASYSVKLAEPLPPPTPKSGDNNLSSLTIGNAVFSPNFSSSTTYYTAKVPYSVSTLSINAKASHAKAQVAVTNNALVPDATTNVYITVTAENGSKKTYTIAVTREQDPNYVPSGDNTLSALSVEPGILSPVFDKDKESYVVWLPYEVESVAVDATPTDGKATVLVEGGEALLAGQDNEILVTCTAENGDKKRYKIIAKRAVDPEGDGEADLPEAPKNSEELLEVVRKKGEAEDFSVLFADFSQQANPTLTAPLLEALRQYPWIQAYITLSEGLTIGINGYDIGSIPADGVVFSPGMPGDLEGQFADLVGKEGLFSFSAGAGTLPFEALWLMKTGLNDGETVRLYGYDAENARYLLLQQDVAVGGDGLVSFRSDYAGELGITGAEVEDAVPYALRDVQQTEENNPPLWLLAAVGAGVLLIGGGLGFLLRWLIERHLRKKERRLDSGPHRFRKV